MATVQLATRVDAEVKAAMERYCKANGVKISYFVREAILDRLEELEDAADFVADRNEPTRPLADVLADLGIQSEIL